jgi:protein-S-isoprenylcysteine O-methyltransferase Ste14
LYTAGFLGNFVVPKSIDSGTDGPVGRAALINVLLLGLFGIQHSVMARAGFKTWWTKFVLRPIERSTYVLFSSLVLILVFCQWRPITSVVWQIDHLVAGLILKGLFFTGFLIVLYASFLIDHFDLFGLRQVFLHWQGKEYTEKTFGTPSLYKLIRHPLYLGWIIAFWSTPLMTYGHLLFAIVTTAYIFVAIPLEERDLVRLLGEDYQRYRERIPMMIPWRK